MNGLFFGNDVDWVGKGRLFVIGYLLLVADGQLSAIFSHFDR